MGNQTKTSFLLSVLLHLGLLIPLGSTIKELDFSTRGQAYVSVNLVSKPKTISKPKKSKTLAPPKPKIQPTPTKGPGGRKDAVKNYGNNLKPMTFNSLIKHYVPPKYPDFAIRNEMEGEVVLGLEISDKGKVTRVRLLQSSDYRILDLNAVKAAYQWTFKSKEELIIKKSIIFRLMEDDDPDGIDSY